MGHRYKYSHEHLDFIKIRKSVGQHVSQWLLYFAGSIALAVLYYIIFSTFFYTPEERGLMREHKMLTEQYAVLNERFNQLETVLDDIRQRDNQIYRTIFEADPLPISGNGIGGVNRYEELESYDNAQLVIETYQRLNNLAARVEAQAASLELLADSMKQKELEMYNMPAIQPLLNKDLTRTGSSVGMRIHPYYKVPKMHTGIDFIAAAGVDVMATGGGTVAEVDYSLLGYGNKVVIDHGVNGYSTLYAHLDKIHVVQGQRVKRGQKIATVGSTGMSVAPHLHYEVLQNGEYKDPLSFFFIDVTPAEYDRMIQLATNSGQSLD